jgi:hypothetical protein
MEATEGPKAFDVAKDVQPRMWVVHYKGIVTPPESGTYHFVGGGDDTLFVKFDGKNVLDGSTVFQTGPEGSKGGRVCGSFFKGFAPDVRNTGRIGLPETFL